MFSTKSPEMSSASPATDVRPHDQDTARRDRRPTGQTSPAEKPQRDATEPRPSPSRLEAGPCRYERRLAGEPARRRPRSRSRQSCAHLVRRTVRRGAKSASPPRSPSEHTMTSRAQPESSSSLTKHSTGCTRWGSRERNQTGDRQPRLGSPPATSLSRDRTVLTEYAIVDRRPDPTSSWSRSRRPRADPPRCGRRWRIAAPATSRRGTRSRSPAGSCASASAVASSPSAPRSHNAADRVRRSAFSRCRRASSRADSPAMIALPRQVPGRLGETWGTVSDTRDPPDLGQATSTAQGPPDWARSGAADSRRSRLASRVRRAPDNVIAQTDYVSTT